MWKTFVLERMGVDIPASGVDIPASGVDIPESGVDIPASGVDIPASGVDIPASGVDIPASGVDIPASGVDIPASGVDIPASGVDIPASGMESMHTWCPSRLGVKRCTKQKLQKRYAWKSYYIVICWDTEESRRKVKERVMLLLKGCGCKSGCKSGRCGCIKRRVACGPGCRCINCINTESIPKDTAPIV